MPKATFTEVTCNHCGRPLKYNECYLVISWMYMHPNGLEAHDERVGEFCKRCSALVQLAVQRHVKTQLTARPEPIRTKWKTLVDLNSYTI